MELVVSQFPYHLHAANQYLPPPLDSPSSPSFVSCLRAQNLTSDLSSITFCNSSACCWVRQLILGVRDSRWEIARLAAIAIFAIIAGTGGKSYCSLQVSDPRASPPCSSWLGTVRIPSCSAFGLLLAKLLLHMLTGCNSQDVWSTTPGLKTAQNPKAMRDALEYSELSIISAAQRIRVLGASPALHFQIKMPPFKVAASPLSNKAPWPNDPSRPSSNGVVSTISIWRVRPLPPIQAK